MKVLLDKEHMLIRAILIRECTWIFVTVKYTVQLFLFLIQFIRGSVQLLTKFNDRNLMCCTRYSEKLIHIQQ